MILTSLENFIKADNLSEDAIYVFRLSATNSVSTVSTNLSQEVCTTNIIIITIEVIWVWIWVAVIFTITCLCIILDTTDIQLVAISVRETINEILIVCNFILGSDARGCAVELIGHVDKNIIKFNYRRNDIRESVVLYELPCPLSCYYKVHAFDIEADGSIAILLVPVVLLYGNELTLCIVTKVNPEGPI